MTFDSLRPALLVLAAAVGLASFAADQAAAQTRLKFVLNWKYQGPQGWFFVAEDKGYYKAEGIDVTIDQGDGSAAAVPKVASGTYDIGFGDINALIEFAARKPEEAPLAVYVMYNRPQFTVAVKTESPIKTPKDFEGRTLGGPRTTARSSSFPRLPRSPSSTHRRSTSPPLRPTCASKCSCADRSTAYLDTSTPSFSAPSSWASIRRNNCAG
jgi:NitT/TauT family transport system substrate-binding protein